MPELVAHARGHGLLVIADAKRGDIDVTRRGLCGGADRRRCDTVWPPARPGGRSRDGEPADGRDAVEPFVAAARAAGAGVLVLVRTSNPGAADVRGPRARRRGTVWERIAEPRRGARAAGGGRGRPQRRRRGGWRDRAAAPARARELMPHAPFLLPGVGAQGGSVEELAPAFAPGRAGGLVSASRSIANAHLQRGGDPRGGGAVRGGAAARARLGALAGAERRLAHRARTIRGHPRASAAGSASLLWCGPWHPLPEWRRKPGR